MNLRKTILDNNPEDIKAILGSIVDMFFDKAHAKERFPQPIDIGKLKLGFDQSGKDIASLLETIENSVFNCAIYKSKSQYLRFIDNGVNSVNVLCGAINALLNQNLTAHLTDSPGGTLIERELLIRIRRLIGFPSIDTDTPSIQNIGGYFTSGGMMGNMAGLLVARNSVFPDAQQKGVAGNNCKIIVPSFSSHYSSWLAAGWLGFGEENVVHVETNNFRYNLEELRNTIDSLEHAGNQILFLSASIGDPYSMSIDNLKEIHKICDKHGIWMHGDGANGGILALSGNNRNLVEGIELCDSVTMDPHKALGLTYPCSVFLCKSIEKFNSVISSWVMINKPDSLDLGATTPFLNSRSFDSLKLWLLFEFLGTEGVARLIDNKIAATKKIYLQMRNEPGNNFVFWNDPSTFSILFQILPKDSYLYKIKSDFGSLDKLQLDWRQVLANDTGIELHEFDLPARICYKDAAIGVFTKVICVQNGHESVATDMIQAIIQHARNFISTRKGLYD